MDQKELMHQILDQMSAHGDGILAACSTIPEQFQQGNHEEGVALLRDLVDTVGWLAHALELTQPLQSERGLSIDLSPLTEVVKPFLQALENKDYHWAGEVLQYELQPLLRSWFDELAKLGPCPTVPASAGPQHAN